MALLEYQTISSLRDKAHDGVLCTFSNRSVLNRGKCSLSSSQPGGPPCWTSPLAFGLIGFSLSLVGDFASLFFFTYNGTYFE
jgi:hypothetical protein